MIKKALKQFGAIAVFLVIFMLMGIVKIAAQTDRIMKRPVEWQTRTEYGHLKTFNVEQDYWIATSLRHNNALFKNHACTDKTDLMLEFTENVYVINYSGDKVKVVKLDHINPSDMTLKPSSVNNSGWIHIDNLVLSNRCLSVTVNLEGFNGTMINMKGLVVNNMGENRNPRLYSDPELANFKKEIGDFKHAFVFDIKKFPGKIQKRDSITRYLIGFKPTLNEVNQSQSIAGWVDQDNFIRWNVNIALETNWDRTIQDITKIRIYTDLNDATSLNIDPQANSYPVTDLKTGSRPSGYMPRYFKLHNHENLTYITKTGYIGDLCFVDGSGNMRCLNPEGISFLEEKFTMIKERMNRVNLIFVVDGTQSIQPFANEINQSINDAIVEINRILQKDRAMDMNYGAVMYWDKKFKKQTARHEWSKNPASITNFIKNELNAKLSGPGDDHPEMFIQGLLEALRAFSYHPLNTNLIVLIGDAGSRPSEFEQYKEDVISRFSENFFNILAFQFKHRSGENVDHAYDLFREQIKEITTTSLQKKLNRKIDSSSTQGTEVNTWRIANVDGSFWLKYPHDEDELTSQTVKGEINDGLTSVFKGSFGPIFEVAKEEIRNAGPEISQGTREILANLSDGALHLLWQYYIEKKDLNIKMTQLADEGWVNRKAVDGKAPFYDVVLYDINKLDRIKSSLEILTDVDMASAEDIRKEIKSQWWEIIKDMGHVEGGQISQQVLDLSLKQLSEIMTGLPGKEDWDSIKLRQITSSLDFPDSELYEYLFEWVIAKLALKSILEKDVKNINKELNDITGENIEPYFWDILVPWYESYDENAYVDPPDNEISSFCEALARFINKSFDDRGMPFKIPEVDGLGGVLHYWIDSRVFPHDLVVGESSFHDYLVAEMKKIAD